MGDKKDMHLETNTYSTRGKHIRGEVFDVKCRNNTKIMNLYQRYVFLSYTIVGNRHNDCYSTEIVLA
jgi:hypothetical protein